MVILIYRSLVTINSALSIHCNIQLLITFGVSTPILRFLYSCEDDNEKFEALKFLKVDTLLLFLLILDFYLVKRFSHWFNCFCSECFCLCLDEDNLQLFIYLFKPNFLVPFLTVCSVMMMKT
jgi:hypothetical protein